MYLSCLAKNVLPNLLSKKGFRHTRQGNGQFKPSSRCLCFETANAICQLECNWIWERIISTMKLE